MNDKIKNILPHLIALLLMFALSSLFFSPYVFQGKVINQSDNVFGRGMQTEIHKYHKEHGETILWTNAAFGGMPTYQIHLRTGKNLINYPFYALLFYQSVRAPHTAAFLGMACMYLFLLVLRVDWRLAMAGGIAMGLCNYNIDLFVAGHSTKILALCYLSAMLAGVILLFRNKWLLGASLYGFALALQLNSNHIQITYYSGFIVGIYILINLFYSIRDKENNNLQNTLKSIGFLILFSLLAFGTAMPRLWTTSEYAKVSQRGSSELVEKQGKDGLDKEYAMKYSLGFNEALLSSLAPNYYGGGKEYSTVKNTQVYKSINTKLIQGYQQQRNMALPEAEKEAKKYLSNFIYTGNKDAPGATIYFGILIWLFFIIGIVLYKGKEKWLFVSSAVLMFLISLGNSFPLNGFLFDYFPYFNKFRALSMAMGLVQLSMIALALSGCSQLFKSEIDKKLKLKSLYIAGGSLLGILVLMMLSGFIGDFTHAEKDVEFLSKFGNNILQQLKQDRQALMSADVSRSIFLVLLSFGIIWAYLNEKLRALTTIVVISLIMVLDVFMISKRMVASEKYDEIKTTSIDIKPLAVDNEILEREKDIHYRVLDISNQIQGPYQDSRASYHHKNMGGYFAAKLMIFEELKAKYLGNPTKHPKILGMFNVKYLIGKTQQDLTKAAVFPVSDACGNAWFVEDYQLVENADSELEYLIKLEPKERAVINRKYEEYMEGYKLANDPNSYIKLSSYHPDRMEYTYTSSVEQLACFSEMFYEPKKGWNVYLNGEKIDPFIRANFAIRAMRLPPANDAKLVMKFEPRSYYLGSNIALVTSLLLILSFIAALYFYFKKNGLKAPFVIENKELAPKAKKKDKVNKKKSNVKSKKDTRNKKR